MLPGETLRSQGYDEGLTAFNDPAPPRSEINPTAIRSPKRKGNLSGEISDRGREKGEERRAALDPPGSLESWDLSPGAVDDGARVGSEQGPNDVVDEVACGLEDLSAERARGDQPVVNG